MESASKAFIMAFGMVVAVMIMSLIVFVFSKISNLPNEKDFELMTQQVAAFNNEYTAYDKKIMYGVDIISVLNKALSNNEKYVRENFVTGGGYNTDFVIDIEIHLNKTLEEMMTISYIDNTSGKLIAQRDYMTGEGPKEGGSFFLAKDKFKKIPSEGYQELVYGDKNYWKTTLKFITQSYETNITPGEYHLLGEDGEMPPPDPENDSVAKKDKQLNSKNKLKALLEQSTTMSQIVKNNKGNTAYETGWSQAEWRPVTYDLKKRKFRCIGDKTIISEKTGRVIKMVFEEI